MYNWQEIIDEFLLDIQVKGYAEQTVYNYRLKLKNIKDYFQSKNIEKNCEVLSAIIGGFYNLTVEVARP